MSEERDIVEQIAMLEAYLLSVPKSLLIVATSDNETEKEICEEVELRIKHKVLIEHFTFSQDSTEQLSLSQYLGRLSTPLQQSALFAFGLDNLSKDSRNIAISALNWGRERLRWAGYAVVLWVRIGTPAELGNRAPDFFSWRSDVFEFDLPKDYNERQQILAQLKLFTNAEAEISQLWSQYCNYVIQRYDWVNFQQLVGNSNIFKLRLEDIYIPLTLTKVIESFPVMISLNDVSTKRVEWQEPNFYQSKREFPLQYLFNYKQVILLGEPGSGKSTILHYLAISFAKDGHFKQNEVALSEPLLPILVSLPIFAEVLEDFKLEPLENLLVTYFIRQGLPDCSRLFQSALRQNQVIFLLDGLDEVSYQCYTLVINIIADFINRYPLIHIIIARRLVGFNKQSLPTEFEVFSINPLTDFAISGFVKRWAFAFEAKILSSNNTEKRAAVRASSLLEGLKKVKTWSSIASSPILLTLLAVLHSQLNVLPQRYLELYKLFVETLIKAHYSKFLLVLANRNDWYFREKNIDQKLIISIVAYVAYRQQEVMEQLITDEDLKHNVAAFFTSKGFSDDSADLLAEEFVALVANTTGIIVERAPNLFGFLHINIQEYLTAYYLSNLEDKVDRFNKLKNHLRSSCWRQIILLTAASLDSKSSEEFLEQILNANLNFDKFFENLKELKLDNLNKDKTKRVLYSIADLFLTAYCLKENTEPLLKLSSEIRDTLFNLWFDVPFSGLRSKLVQLFVYLKESVLEVDIFNFLLQVVNDKKQMEYLRSDTISAISDMEVRNEDLVKLLLEISQDKNEPNHIRRAAVSALGKMGKEDKEVIQVLLSLMKDKTNNYINTSVATSLGQVCETDIETIDLLISILCDPSVDSWIRVNAAWSLGEIKSEKVIKILFQMLNAYGEDTIVRRAVASALGKSIKLGNITIIEPLLNIIKNPSEDESVRKNLISSELAKLSQAEKEITSILMSILLDENRPGVIRWSVTSTLVEIGEFSDQEIDALIAILQDKNKDSLLRKGVASILGVIGKNNKSVIGCLVNVFTDYGDDKWVRGHVVSVLSKVGKGNEEILEKFFSHIMSENDVSTRDYVMRNYILEGLWELLIEI